VQGAESELSDQQSRRRAVTVDEFGAELHRERGESPVGVDAPADAITRFKENHSAAGVVQITRSR
jgi:hypothetical protein